MFSSLLSLRVVENSPGAIRWNRLLQEIERRTIRVTSPLILQEGISGGSMLSLSQILNFGGGAALTFTGSRSSLLTVSMTGGLVVWHDKVFTIADVNFVIPVSQTAYPIWVELVQAPSTQNEFNPNAAIFQADTATNWPAYPNQPNPPARGMFLICTVDTDVTDITSVDNVWHGGDIVWPSIYSFWY